MSVRMKNLALFAVLGAIAARAAPMAQADTAAEAIPAPDYSMHNQCSPDGSGIYVGDEIVAAPAGAKCEGGFLVND